MKSYHINPATGNPNICRATKGNCPFGEPKEHYSSQEEARQSYEKLQGSPFSTNESIKVYHGSAHRFEEFDYRFIGAQGTSEGQGFYFTDSEEVAGHYGEGGYLYEVDFHGKRPLSIKQVTLTRQDFRALLLNIHRENDYLENWGDVEYEGEKVVLDRAIDGLYYVNEGSNDVDMVGDLINSAGGPKAVYRYLYDTYGYDHIPAKVNWGAPGQTVYVATVPEAFTIRSVRPLTP